MVAAYVRVLRVTAISAVFVIVVLAATLIAIVAAAVGLVREAAVELHALVRDYRRGLNSRESSS